MGPRSARALAVRHKLINIARAVVAPGAYTFNPPLVEPLTSKAVEEAGYSSQLGQDLLIDRHVFAGRREGFFVDVGAHDGVTWNNTVFFERERAWSGLCIEPNPNVFPRLQSARRAECIRAAVGPNDASVPFQVVTGYAEMLSGVDTAYDRRHRARLERERAEFGGDSQIIKVPMRRLDTVLRNAGMDRVDLLSIDVEGGEGGVLDSIDLRTFHVAAVIIENYFHKWSIARRFRRQGYQLMLRLGFDELYMPNPARLA
jgi:FkbM family methyltransferase